MKIESVAFRDEEGKEVEFYVECDARIAGVNYLLVTESPDGDSDALILKDMSADSDVEADYVIVEDEKELDSVLKVFEELLEDTEIEK